jgi:hypothetical protein
MAQTSRRAFVLKSAVSCLGIFAGVFGSCDQKKPDRDNKAGDMKLDPCDDFENVSESDLALRQKFGYVNKSPIPENQCNNCNLYLPGKTAKDCGGCMLFKGPVYAFGYCTYWAPRV